MRGKVKKEELQRQKKKGKTKEILIWIHEE
jgi:hypothetical protein